MPHASVAVVCVPIVEALTGALLIAQPGTGITAAAVVKVVLLEMSQPTAGPLAFLGTIYQLYNEPAVRLVALYVHEPSLIVAAGL